MPLYEVTVEFTYYAVADDERGAEWMAKDAANDEDLCNCASASLINKHATLAWPGDSLVYGSEKDTTLDEALAAMGLPSAAEIRRAHIEKMTKHLAGANP
jgi:hypothetical protein